MILNTLPPTGAYRSYAPSLLYMYLTGEGLLDLLRQRESTGEGPLESVRRRRSDGEDPTKKVQRRRFNEKVTLSLKEELSSPTLEYDKVPLILEGQF